MEGETPSFPGNTVSMQQWIPSPLRGGGLGWGGGPARRGRPAFEPFPSPYPLPPGEEGEILNPLFFNPSGPGSYSLSASLSAFRLNNRAAYDRWSASVTML